MFRYKGFIIKTGDHKFTWEVLRENNDTCQYESMNEGMKDEMECIEFIEEFLI